MRPVLSDEQAAGFTREAVLSRVGPAGAERVETWAPLVADAMPDMVVGQGGFASVQAAVNRAVEQGRRGRVVVGVSPGVWPGLVYLPKGDLAFTLKGLGRVPSDVVLQDTIDAEMPAAEYARRFAALGRAPEAVAAMYRRIAAREGIITTANASVLRVEADDTVLRGLTVRNSYNADRAGEGARNALGQYRTGQHQAVALLVAGADRVTVDRVHLKSMQDTLYLQSPSKGQTVRTCLTDCDIEGDVDFIFGQSSAWFERCTLRALGHRAPMAWYTAPSTDLRTTYGFVFDNCEFVSDGAGGACALGRQWFEGVRATPFGPSPVPGYRCDLGAESTYDPPHGTISKATLESVGKCVILRSRIGAHVDRARVWDDWAGRVWAPRHRPALYTAGDMLTRLEGWLAAQGLSYPDVDAGMVLLGEYGSVDV